MVGGLKIFIGVLIGVGIGSGGAGALDAMLNGASVPWVLDPSEEVWDEFLGPNAPRRQIVLLDQNLEKRFQQQYSGALNNTQLNELVSIIEQLIDEASILLGDMNADNELNILDIVILANLILSGDNNLNGDLNQDGSLNILDIVNLVNTILND